MVVEESSSQDVTLSRSYWLWVSFGIAPHAVGSALPFRDRTGARICGLRGTQVMKSFLLFALPSFFRLSSPWSSFFNFPLTFLFYILNGGNYGLLHSLIQTLCLHLSLSTPLHKTFMADHYLRFDYVQSACWIYCLPLPANNISHVTFLYHSIIILLGCIPWGCEAILVEPWSLGSCLV